MPSNSFLRDRGCVFDRSSLTTDPSQLLNEALEPLDDETLRMDEEPVNNVSLNVDAQEPPTRPVCVIMIVVAGPSSINRLLSEQNIHQLS